MIRLHLINPRYVTNKHLLPTTWSKGFACVVWYSPADEKVIELHTVESINTSKAKDRHGNKDCTHLQVKGDLYVLPDSWKLVSRPNDYGEYILTYNGSQMSTNSFDKLVVAPTGPGSVTISFKHDNGDRTASYSWSGLPSRELGDYVTVGMSVSWHDGWASWSGSGSTTCKSGWPFFTTAYATLHGSGVNWGPIDYASDGWQLPTKEEVLHSYDTSPSFADTLDTLIPWIKSLLSEYIVLKSNEKWGPQSEADALVDAIDGLKEVNINSWAYLHDLHGTASLLRFAKTAKKIRRTMKHPTKAIANAWLSYRYGIRLFLSDTRDIAKAMLRTRGDRWTSSRGTRKSTHTMPLGGDVSVESHVKVYSDLIPLEQAGFSELARRLDLFPSTRNIWDFIPYSFVVDWIIPVADELGRRDAVKDMNTFRIHSIVASTKTSQTWRYEGLAHAGTIQVSYYKRRVYTNMEEAKKLLLSAPLNFLGGLFSWTHLLDGFGLTVQRRR